MVKLGKMMWNAKVKPVWTRSRKTGSRVILGLASSAGPSLPQYRSARQNRGENARFARLSLHCGRGQVAKSRRRAKVHGLFCRNRAADFGGGPLETPCANPPAKQRSAPRTLPFSTAISGSAKTAP